MSNRDCRQWDGERCLLKLFGGTPSEGVCMGVCKSREPIPGFIPLRVVTPALARDPLPDPNDREAMCRWFDDHTGIGDRRALYRVVTGRPCLCKESKGPLMAAWREAGCPRW